MAKSLQERLAEFASREWRPAIRADNFKYVVLAKSAHEALQRLKRDFAARYPLHDVDIVEAFIVEQALLVYRVPEKTPDETVTDNTVTVTVTLSHEAWLAATFATDPRKPLTEAAASKVIEAAILAYNPKGR